MSQPDRATKKNTALGTLHVLARKSGWKIVEVKSTQYHHAPKRKPWRTTSFELTVTTPDAVHHIKTEAVKESDKPTNTHAAACRRLLESITRPEYMTVHVTPRVSSDDESAEEVSGVVDIADTLVMGEAGDDTAILDDLTLEDI